MADSVIQGEGFTVRESKYLSLKNAMKIQTINQVEFNQINAFRQVITHEYPRQFAILDFGNNLERYGISWNSDLIEPMVKLSPDGQTRANASKLYVSRTWYIGE